MGVPNSREYNYYQAPNTPFRILLKSKYIYLYISVWAERWSFMFSHYFKRSLFLGILCAYKEFKTPVLLMLWFVCFFDGDVKLL